MLDHILMTPNMVPALAGITPVHVNADYPFPEAVDALTPYHSSDHDPVAMRIRPDGAGWLTAAAAGAEGVMLQLAGAAGEVVATAQSDADGELRAWGLLPGDYTMTVSVSDELLVQRAVVEQNGRVIDCDITPCSGVSWQESVSIVAGENILELPPIQQRAGIWDGGISASLLWLIITLL